MALRHVQKDANPCEASFMSEQTMTTQSPRPTVNKNNMAYPVLRPSPCFGDGLRPHVDGIISETYQTYLSSPDRPLCVSVEWGEGGGFLRHHPLEDENDVAPSWRAELTIHGLGRRPAYQLLVQEEKLWTATDPTQLPTIQVTWKTANSIHPEYLATLRMFRVHNTPTSMELFVLERTLHVLPPPELQLNYSLPDVLRGPRISNGRDNHQNNSQPQQNSATKSTTESCSETTERGLIRRRRGFGLELETVQLPPSDEECLTHQEALYAAVKKARATTSDKITPEKWHRLLQWKVEQDLQVANAAPYARLDLWKQWQALQKDQQPQHGSCYTDNCNHLLAALIMGGGREEDDLPEEYKDLLDSVSTYHLSSPEYKSPSPPYELYHSFPTDDGQADEEIRLLLHTIQQSSQPGVLCPTISHLGMSASSIHVHVNICNPEAWPRMALDGNNNNNNDWDLTRSLLSVVLNWIRFDGVIRQFCQPWMWRDRDLMSLHASGPECVYPEVAWKQGTTIVPWSEGALEFWNVAAFFDHIYQTYRNRNHEKCDPLTDGTSTCSSSEPGDDDESEHDDNECNWLFGQADPETNGRSRVSSSSSSKTDEEENALPLFHSVFDDDVIRKTLGRKCSLNLLSLKKYGTVEIRRMHATLDADFVTAWTRLCVGFVEHFSATANHDEFTTKCLEDSVDSLAGLERLVEAQNHATMEDLIEILAQGDSPAVPHLVFDTLLLQVANTSS